MQAILLSGLVIFFSFTLEAITGFGCTVMAVPFVTALLGMHDGVVILTVLSMLLALYITIRNFKYIDFKHFLVIVLLMLPGLFVGRYFQNTFNTKVLKIILAVFIMMVSSFKLVKFFLDKNFQDNKKNKTNANSNVNSNVKWYSYVALVLSGIIHGMFSSGGPLVIIYAANAVKEKNSFRATLCLLWTVLNSILCISYLTDGSINVDTGKIMLYLLPFMLFGIIAGELVAKRVNEKIFTIMVYICLFLTGIFMLI